MLNFSIISRGYLVRPMHDGLVANGCQVQLQPDMEKWDFQNCDYLLLHGPADPIGTMIKRLGIAADIPPLVVWYSEQVPNPKRPAWMVRLLSRLRYAAEPWYGEKLAGGGKSRSTSVKMPPGFVRWRRIGELLALHSMGCLRLVCTFSRTQKDFLEKLGLPAVELPFGHHPDFGTALNLPRDIDILFLGSTSDYRRRRLFPSILSKFAEKGIPLMIVDGSPERGAYYGDERTRLLNRTKILLNVMKQPWDDPTFRLLLAAANGTLLLSEPVWESSLWGYTPNVHFAACELDRLAETAARYLHDEPARLEMASWAAVDITQNSGMAQMTGQLIDLLDQHKEPGH